MTEDRRTLRDLLRERHERGAAVLGGRIRPEGDRLVIDRYEPRGSTNRRMAARSVPRTRASSTDPTEETEQCSDVQTLT